MRRVPASLFRGGTSKGLYLLASDLPEQVHLRDGILLAIMGSPDRRQIDGLGGAHPLTSKVAIVSPSSSPDCDVDYLFLQVSVESNTVSDAQNCGNILAGVGPFAIEQGLVEGNEGMTSVRINMINTGGKAIVTVQTPDKTVCYEGSSRIDGVPGTSAPVMIEFLDIAGASCGSLFPTGNTIDRIDGVPVTCVDNGMPVVIIAAKDMGLNGTEAPEELESMSELTSRLESIRLKAGGCMGLGDVTNKTVPKMSLVSPPVNGGSIHTRTFIPHRVHEAIGVLGAVSVATAIGLKGTVAEQQVVSSQLNTDALEIEHPTGAFTVALDISGPGSLDGFSVNRTALLRTARLLMRGDAFYSTSPAAE